MSNVVVTKGIVLSEMVIKESDKRVVIFTDQLGKVVAFANGAKRSKSTLLAGTQLFAFAEFHLIELRNSYKLVHIELIESFYPLRQDLDKLSLGIYLLEVVNAVTAEEDVNLELLRLLYLALCHIKQADQTLQTVKAIFEWRCLCYIGYAPQLEQCVICNRSENLVELSVRGMICSDCTTGGLRIKNEMLDLLRAIQSLDLPKLFHIIVRPELEADLHRIVQDHFRHYVRKEFNSLHLFGGGAKQ